MQITCAIPDLVSFLFHTNPIIAGDAAVSDIAFRASA
jgi:hypothetical protein